MGTDSHASDVGHWLGMTPLRGVRGDAPQGYLFRFAPLRGHRPLRTSNEGAARQRLSHRHEAHLLLSVFGKQGGGFTAVGLRVLADVLNGGLIQLALDPGG